MTNGRTQPQQPAASRILDFQCREETAALWATHDFMELLPKTQLVKHCDSKQLSEDVTARVDRQDREELYRRANEQDV